MSYIQLILHRGVFVLMLAKVLKFESSDGPIAQGSCGRGAALDPGWNFLTKSVSLSILFTHAAQKGMTSQRFFCLWQAGWPFTVELF